MSTNVIGEQKESQTKDYATNSDVKCSKIRPIGAGAKESLWLRMFAVLKTNQSSSLRTHVTCGS